MKTQIQSHLQVRLPQLRPKGLWFQVCWTLQWCFHQLLLWGSCMTYRSLKCFLPSCQPLPSGVTPCSPVGIHLCKMNQATEKGLIYIELFTYPGECISFTFIFQPWECFFICADVTSPQYSTAQHMKNVSWLPSSLCTLAEGYRAQSEVYLTA